MGPMGLRSYFGRRALGSGALTAGNGTREDASAVTTAKPAKLQYTHPVIMKQRQLGNSDGFGHPITEMSIQRNKTTLIRIRLS